MLIRAETPADFKEIHALVKTAFETARVKDGDEHDYVDRLRKAGGYIPDLALVAEEGGHLVGHIMLTRLSVKTDPDRHVLALLLAPLSVLLEHRCKGVGAILMHEAVRRAREMEFDGIFLAGDPGYYGRFGFRRADSYGVVYTGEIPPQFLLALELRPGSLVMGEVDMTVA